jgi:DNA repair protein RadC
VFIILILNSANNLIRDVQISEGILNSSLVHPREVFKSAILESAASIILLHNHPSGEAEPSQEDKNITRRLLEAGKLIDIPVLDHIIIGQRKYFSFREAGLIEE